MRLVARSIAALIPLAFSTAAMGQWKEVTEPSLGYTAAFPVKPEARAAVYKGVPQSVNSAATTGVFCNVSVSHYEQPVDAATELARSRDNIVNDTGGKIASAKEITVNRGDKQLPALELETSNQIYKMRALIVVDGDRVYQVAGGVPSEGGRKGDLERCIRGLKLTAD